MINPFRSQYCRYNSGSLHDMFDAVLTCVGTGAEVMSAVFKVKRSLLLCKAVLSVIVLLSKLLYFLAKMRRTTLGTLNIGNHSRQVTREKKTSLGPRPSIGNRTSIGRPSTSGRPSLANARSATGR